MPISIKKLILILAVLTAMVSPARAASLDVPANYPSPLGEYDQIRLPPRATLTGPCEIGTFYSEAPGTLKFCADGTWDNPASIVWTQPVQKAYPVDTRAGIHVGIGTGAARPEFKLTLERDGGILAKGTVGAGANLTTSGAGERMIWYPKKAAFRVGSTTGDDWNDAGISNYSTITGGKGNKAVFPFSGYTADYVTISGGEGNISQNHYNTISGGKNNRTTFFALFMINDQYNVISGGANNQAGGAYNGSAVVSGGEGNTAGGDYNVVAGGKNNMAGADFAAFSYSSMTVSGGENNLANQTGATVSGGLNNQASNYSSTVCGGEGNVITEQSSVISGGLNNSAYRSDTVSGGQSNAANLYSVVSGGQSNTAGGFHSVVSGGQSNTANGYSVVSGGQSNTASSVEASVVSGGEGNVAAGDYSWVGGRNMHLSALADRTFLWGHAALPITPIDTPDAFIIYSGRVGIGAGAIDPQAKLHVDGSIRAVLTDFAVNPADPLVYNPVNGEIGYDIAELFDTTEEVETGDILVIDENAPVKLKKSRAPYDPKVAGAVSFAPAITFEGSRLEVAPAPGKFTRGTKPPVALAGRVVCKVTTENGPIQKGDLLTTSSIPGHAMKATDPRKAFGAVVGKALESFTGGPDGKTTGMITILVTLQ